MIKATIHHYKGHVAGFTITGHADAGEYGQDIVCSAVSVLSITTVNGLQEVVGLDVDVDSDEKNGGYLSVEIPVTTNSTKQLQSDAVLKTFENGMADIATSYSQYIKLNVEN
ncbi:ribosomal-processing cysteine protease Prp [Lentilactobacillus farraginis]|uniref:Ribosomal processing cysteine protease Prp n=1 Tax=Lentilactobacillus farraginis DSM 18382 = JCM 14108 TaxID=1423743 RepID=X0PA53_9LACO|nr:ribosomal-processing cysteine protease Prp [Lentilactobacillus farraginis]KRM04352.1 ribosomal protein [Lentilactobacillus farraginis DSM 18382 = JCM 14108]GAF36033.1 potential ribosomal protein [Lentilactobacillus farraginis DSM 18382 = JCM 14108]